MANVFHKKTMKPILTDTVITDAPGSCVATWTDLPSAICKAGI